MSPQPTAASAPPDEESRDETRAEGAVDSRWWYWIAAVPVYTLLATVVGVVAVAAVVLGALADVAGVTFLLLVLAVLLLAIPGLVLTVLFPLATYLDAKAVADADLEWHPDPVLYGLIALASVLLTGFTIGVVLALYYLYQRHKHVGTP